MGINCVTLTLNYNRFTLMRRNLKSFLDQVYDDSVDSHTLVIFNTGSRIELDPSVFKTLSPKQNIILINSCDKSYFSVGEKYNDALDIISKWYDNWEVINFVDSDDYSLPYNTIEGVKGYAKAKELEMEAYKPYYSYFLNGSSPSLEHNVFEGSMFISYKWIKKYKFLTNSVKYHDGWLTPLVDQSKIMVLKEGKPSWVYTWSNPEADTYKMSGNLDTTDNFISSQNLQNDTGEGKKLTPYSNEEMQYYYACIK